MNRLLSSIAVKIAVALGLTACADWSTKPQPDLTDKCNFGKDIVFSKDSSFVELPYQKIVPVEGGNFSLELYKIEADVSEDICSKFTYPEVRVFVRVIYKDCREDLNYFRFGRCPQYGHLLILPPFRGCKISSDITGYSWVMAYNNLIFSVNTLVPYLKTSQELKQLEVNPSGYVFKIWVKKRC